LGTGSTALGDGVSFGRGVVAEAAATFLIVTAIMALAVDRRAPGGWAGLMIGLFGHLRDHRLRPGHRRLAQPGALLRAGAGDGARRRRRGMGDFPVYIPGPLIGGAAAAFAYDAIARPRLVEVEPPQGTEGDIRARRVKPEPADAGRQGTGGDIAGRRR
jgi:glycerol uptake facilitator protein